MKTSHSLILATVNSPSHRWLSAKTNPPKQKTAIAIRNRNWPSMARRLRIRTLLVMVANTRRGNRKQAATERTAKHWSADQGSL